jgi:hypothetical protein
MKTKILSIATVLFIAIAITSCTKEETTYQGKEFFYWDADLNDSIVEYEVDRVQITVEGVILGNIEVSNFPFTTPGCDGAGVLTVTKDLGTETSKTYSLQVRLLDVDGDEVVAPLSATITLQGDACKDYLITADQFSW